MLIMQLKHTNSKSKHLHNIRYAAPLALKYKIENPLINFMIFLGLLSSTYSFVCRWIIHPKYANGVSA